jgi:hypothetical protein
MNSWRRKVAVGEGYRKSDLLTGGVERLVEVKQNMESSPDFSHLLVTKRWKGRKRVPQAPANVL